MDIHIKASGSQYLGFAKKLPACKDKNCEGRHNSNLEEADVVIHVNLWIQQKLVSSWGTNFAYKAYMDVLLNFSEDAERSQMQTQLFYKDSARAFDQSKVTEIPLNQGLILRQKLDKNSQFH